MRRNQLVVFVLVLAIALSFIFVNTAMAALETQLLTDVSPSTDNVPYQQTQWYGYNAIGGKGYSITLSPSTGNSDPYLFDTNFNLVGSSKNTGLTKDKVWYGQSTSGPMHIGCFGAYNPSSNFTVQVITAPYVKTMTPVSGGAGTLVTLTGFGFGASRGSNYVMFGSVKAINYPVWTNTQIQVYVPSGVASGAIQAVVYVSSKASNPNNFAANNGSSDGTMYKYDLGRTSSSPNGPTALPLRLKWTYNAGEGEYMCLPPMVANNIAYISAVQSGKLLAIDATTGLLKWSYSKTNFQYFYNIPTVAGGVLYILGSDIEDGGYTISVMLFAFDANTGSLKWKYNTKNQDSSDNINLAVFNNVVYFPVGTKVYAVDAINGTLKWTYATQVKFSTYCAISNGVVYAGSQPIYNGNSKVYALDAVTGAVKWTYTIPEVNKSVCGISVANGVVYFGTYGSGTWTGALYALDANTGSVKWKNTGHIDVRMVGVADGIVYANVNNGGWSSTAFDANTGVAKWGTVDDGDLSISNGLVFAGSNSSSLDALDAKTGVVKWSYNNFSNYAVIGPFVYNGNVYVCANSNLYCLGQ